MEEFNKLNILQKRKFQANTTDDYRCKYLQENISKPNSTIHEEENAA